MYTCLLYFGCFKLWQTLTQKKASMQCMTLLWPFFRCVQFLRFYLPWLAQLTATSTALFPIPMMSTLLPSMPLVTTSLYFTLWRTLPVHREHLHLHIYMKIVHLYYIDWILVISSENSNFNYEFAPNSQSFIN